MMKLKSMMVGAVAGILSTLVGVGLAKAECHQDDRTSPVVVAEEACDDAAQGWLEDGVPYSSVQVMHDACMALLSRPTLSAEAYERARDAAELTCGEAAASWEAAGLPESSIGGWSGMWEACMRLSVPVGPLPAAQHYDTQDGAFWSYR